MSGRILINYRREDSLGSAGRLYDRMVDHLSREQVFMDVDAIEPGVDFVEVIEHAIKNCDVFLAVIGPNWLTVTDDEGKRRLDNPNDFVRLEIAAALERGIRIIPVLVKGATMPRSIELPDNLKPLARRNALEISHTRFDTDADRLVRAIERAFHQLEISEKATEEPVRPNSKKKVKSTYWIASVFAILLGSLGIIYGPKLLAEQSTVTYETETAPPTRTQIIPTIVSDAIIISPTATSKPTTGLSEQAKKTGELLELCGYQLCITNDEDQHIIVPLDNLDQIGGYSWSPDGSQIVFHACQTEDTIAGIDSCYDIYITDRDGNKVDLRVSELWNMAMTPAWSPDGKWISFHRACGLIIKSLENGSEEILVAEGPSLDNNTCSFSTAWSPDSQQIAWIGGSSYEPVAKTVWVINSDGSNMEAIFKAEDTLLVDHTAGQITWSPDGESVAVVMETGEVYLIDADCYKAINGCDESTRELIQFVPQNWRHDYYPQWTGD